MKSGRSAAAALVALALALFVFPPHAHAYLDPGTGSYLLQIALAAVVGALFAIRMFWSRIKSLFKILFSKRAKVGSDD